MTDTLRDARRIAFVVSSFRGGGAEAVGRAWMQELARSGAQIVAITVGPDPRAESVPDGVRVIPAGGGGQRSRVARVAALLREEEPEVVVSLQTHPNLVAIAAGRRAGIPVVISEHNVVSLGMPGSSLRHRLKMRTARLVYRRAAHAIGCSHAVGAELVSWFGVPGGRVTVVPNPVLAELPADAPAPQPSGDEALHVVLPGRVVPQKRPELAVATVARLRERGVDARLVSFGGGPLVGDLARRAAAADVPFDDRGWVDGWTTAVPRPCVVLLPSRREGAGNVLVEAAAAGIPSVTPSEALGVAEAVIPGITGELAADSSPDTLADAVLAVRGRAIPDVRAWLDRFTFARSTAVLDGVLRRVAGGTA